MPVVRMQGRCPGQARLHACPPPVPNPKEIKPLCTRPSPSSKPFLKSSCRLRKSAAILCRSRMKPPHLSPLACQCLQAMWCSFSRRVVSGVRSRQLLWSLATIVVEPQCHGACQDYPYEATPFVSFRHGRHKNQPVSSQIHGLQSNELTGPT
jgi:hypothetical protein